MEIVCFRFRIYKKEILVDRIFKVEKCLEQFESAMLLSHTQTKVIEENLTDEIVDYLEDELVHEIKVIKLRRVSPHP